MHNNHEKNMPINAYTLPEHQENARAFRIAAQYIASQKLDLRGLTIYTEAATGSYKYTSCIAALAGGKVIALARSNSWASAEVAAAEVRQTASDWGLPNPPLIVFEKQRQHIAAADILTNTGNVRPLDQQTISWMHPTSVIPLMWETYEWRPYELDIQACRAKGILVMGTDETRMGYLRYIPETLIKMLHSVGIALCDSTFLCMASGPMTTAIHHSFTQMGAAIKFCSRNATPDSPFFLSSGEAELSQYLENCDAIICDERFDKQILIGKNGLLTVQDLVEKCSGVVVVNRHGVLDLEELRHNQIFCTPSYEIVKWHAPVATTAILGLRSTLQLMTAGLKVGQAMAHGRKNCTQIAEAAEYALKNSMAQDFLTPYNWINA